ncbi:MAG: hypothetical protein ACKOCR_10250 [Burkholderiaceae bacterium]
MMQWGAEAQSQNATVTSGLAPSGPSTTASSVLSPQAVAADIKVIRRNGAVVGFEPSKIQIAMTKAFLAVGGNQGARMAISCSISVMCAPCNNKLGYVTPMWPICMTNSVSLVEI